ncbi:MAG: helix-turn-helix domain-containing protein [Burkholderiaceae bacterium]
MKLTPFGLLVRKIRLDFGLTLKEMATALSVSSAYLSSVELGEKALSNKLADQALAYLAPKLNKQQYEELQAACAQSMKTVPVSALNVDDRTLVAAFARRLNEGQGVPDAVMKWLKTGGLDGSNQ